MPRGPAQSVPQQLLSATNPLGSHWDELPGRVRLHLPRVRPRSLLLFAPFLDYNGPCLAASTRRYYTDAAAQNAQLVGYGAPKPSETSNEEPLIKGRMRTFPTMHPSLGSVPNAIATGCPAIVHCQMESSEWKTTTQATIDLKEPTIRKRREGKATVDALFGAGDLYTVPIETYVPPANAPPTVVRDQRVFKHMGTLTRSGRW